MATRELGKVESVLIGKDPDHSGLLVGLIHFSFGSGGQAIHIALDEKSARQFKKDMLRVFKADTTPDRDIHILDLVDRECWVLRSFDLDNIEGVESINGKERWTITGFRRRLYPYRETLMPDAQRTRDLLSKIERCQREIMDCTNQLVRVREDYTNWVDGDTFGSR